jgi:hypothetical protein
MALIVSNAKFKNSEVEVQTYTRLEFNSRRNGKEMLIVLFSYASKDSFVDNIENEIDVDLKKIINATLADGETQSLETAHSYAKTELESLGFEVTIDLA